MQAIAENSLLAFEPGTLQGVRAACALEPAPRLHQAIDILQDWVRQQRHFVKKEYPRWYFERLLVLNKGLVERCKRRIDKLCTLRTHLPTFFDVHDVQDIIPTGLYEAGVLLHLPKMTDDYDRVILVRVTGKPITADMFLNFYRHNVIAGEYILRHDYSKGFVIVCDLRDVNIMDFVTKINLVELRNAATLFIDGYGIRIKGIHLLTPSKMADALVSIIKQVVSAKIGSRVHVHRTAEMLHRHVPRHILPVDLGGEERSTEELLEAWLEQLSRKEHVEHVRQMSAACTDETQRRTDKFNEECLGMPGTFRTLVVD